MDIIKTIVNIIIINLKIIFFKKKNNSKKVILFFFSRKNLTLINKNYLDYLFKNFDKNILVIYGHQIKSFQEKNYFFLKESFLLNYLLNIDIFFCNQLSDKFTRNSKKIYMHHDLSTAPLVDKKKEKNLFQRLVKYDFIFTPQKSSSKMFKNFMLRFSKKNFIQRLPVIFESGYPKLDYLRKRKIKKKTSETIIVIAPSDYRHIQKLSIYNEIEDIIDLILKKTSYKIYFRPYPANLKSKKITKIINKYNHINRFYLDDSNDYTNVYSKSKYLLTDISGTAVTYSFFTNKKVIFYSRNEKLVKKKYYANNSYFKDRNKLGVIKNKPIEIVKFLNSGNSKNIRNNLRKEITYLDNSKKRIKYLIKNIIKQYEKKV